MTTSPTIRVSHDSSRITMLDALTRWIRWMPRLVLAGFATVAGILNAFAIGAIVVVTGRRPSGLTSFQVWAVRERVRVFSYFFLLRPDAPPLPSMGHVDDGRDPHTEISSEPGTDLARWEPLARLILVVPYLVVGIPIGLFLDLLYPVAVVVAGANGGWTPRYAAFLTRTDTWVAHGFLYLFLATDVRPPFVPPSPARPEPAAAQAA